MNMAGPRMTTVTIGGNKFNALSAHFGLATHHDHFGLPQMGTLRCAIDCMVDIHDTMNMPYEAMTKLFQLANIVTKEKIADMKIEFWTDDSQSDALCTYSFKGWISSWNTSSGGGSNHTLSISLQPALDNKNFIDFKMGN